MSGESNILKLVGADETPAGSYRLAEQVGFILRKAHQRHVAIFAANIPELTPPQFATLAMLRENGETAQSQLGQLVAMDAATIKGVVDRLRARGLIALKRHGGDKRRLMVSLTADGRQAVDQLIDAAARISDETLAPLSGKEAETLLRLLSRLT